MIKLGLMGYPVGHSLSPKIQNAALQAAGLEGDYSLFPIEPGNLPALKAYLARVRSGELTGLNVTVPHKQNVIPFLDELTPTARSIGAVNVIYLRGNRLIGENTDAAGFLKDLKDHFAPFPSQPSALILGAGGSARSVAYALCKDGWQVTVAARRMEQAQQLVTHFQGVHALELNVPGFPPPNIDLIVNTTPVGMTPDLDQSPLPDHTTLPDQIKVYDLVYNPRETKLVRDARAQGAQATTGLGMLIEQAALGFELWTGIKLPGDIFRSAVE